MIWYVFSWEVSHIMLDIWWSYCVFFCFFEELSLDIRVDYLELFQINVPNCRKFCSINLKYAQDVEYYGCMRSNRYKRRNSILIQYVCICLIFSYSSVSFAYSSSNHSGKILYCSLHINSFFFLPSNQESLL